MCSLRYDEKGDEGYITGSMVTTETFVVIRWQWLSLLATQVVLTIVFLLFVVIHTARLDVEIVKSSNIAELLALKRPCGEIEGVESREPWEGLTAEVEKELTARLTREGNIWTLNIS